MVMSKLYFFINMLNKKETQESTLLNIKITIESVPGPKRY